MAEAKLLDNLIRRARRHHDAQTRLGPGDDAAVIESLPSGMVISTDTYLENSHYRRAWLGPEDLAERCLGAALSDLAAMGALPRFYTLAMTLVGDEEEAWLNAFADRLGELGTHYKIDLIGGDLTRGHQQVLSLTVLGTPTKGRVMRRAGAVVGDGLWVSGTLGAAAAGLAWLEAQGRDQSLVSAAFRQPQPRLILGSTLARMSIASAALDISDGLAVDLHRLCRASGCGARIDTRRLPVDPQVTRVARELNRSAQELVLQGGEDYELLFCVHPAMEEALGDLSSATNVPLTRIGVMTDSKGVTDQVGTAIEPRGWDPFI